MTQRLDTLKALRINRGALHYFGIICFEDIPGYYPQLELETDQQNTNLIGHVKRVVEVMDENKR